MNIELQRRNDKRIMDEVLQSNFLKGKRIQVNVCRLYLRVIYLSDMIEPDGRTVDMNLFSGKRPEYPKFKFTWPNEPNPSTKAWKTWNNMLITILNIQKNGTLPPYHTLQQWLITSNKRHIQHEWYHGTRIKEIYTNNGNAIIQHFSKEIKYHNLK